MKKSIFTFFVLLFAAIGNNLLLAQDFKKDVEKINKSTTSLQTYTCMQTRSTFQNDNPSKSLMVTRRKIVKDKNVTLILDGNDVCLKNKKYLLTLNEEKKVIMFNKLSKRMLHNSVIADKAKLDSLISYSENITYAKDNVSGFPGYIILLKENSGFYSYSFYYDPIKFIIYKQIYEVIDRSEEREKKFSVVISDKVTEGIAESIYRNDFDETNYVIKKNNKWEPAEKYSNYIVLTDLNL